MSLTQVINQHNLVSANSGTAVVLKKSASLEMLTLHTFPVDITQQMTQHPNHSKTNNITTSHYYIETDTKTQETDTKTHWLS